MTRHEEFEIKRDVHLKWMEQFTADELVKLLGDVYEVIDYKRSTEYMLGRDQYCAN